MDRLQGDAEMGRQERAKTGCVEDRPGADDSAGGLARKPGGDGRHHVTGFVATMRIPSGCHRLRSRRMTGRNTSALRPRSSTRVSPGFWASPGGEHERARARQRGEGPVPEVTRVADAKGAAGAMSPGLRRRARAGVAVDEDDLVDRAFEDDGETRPALPTAPAPTGYRSS